MKKQKIIKYALIACIVLFGLLWVFTGYESLTLVEDEGYSDQLEGGKWQYTIVMKFNEENIGEFSVDVEFFDKNNNKIYGVDNTLIQIEKDTVTAYYETEEEATTYRIDEYEVYSSEDGKFSDVYLVLLVVSIGGLIGYSKYLKKKSNSGNNKEEIENPVIAPKDDVKRINVLNKEKLSKKEPPKFEDLVAISDGHIKMLDEGKKDEINKIEARYLGYGIDLVNWAKQTLDMEFTFVESDIEKLDEIVKLYREKADKDKLDEETKNGYAWGIAGIFGIITCHYKNACWIDDNDRDYGHKLKVEYKNADGTSTKSCINLCTLDSINIVDLPEVPSAFLYSTFNL